MNTERRIEWHYAGAQSSFWIGLCALTGYTAVLLESRGFSDVQVGITSSLMSVLTIAFQLVISNFSDHHPGIALRRIIAALYVLAMACGATLLSVSIPVALLMVAYAASGALKSTVIGLFNALIMQYINAGIPVAIGWPRGVASVVYAVCAYLLGRLIEAYSPSILVPVFLGVTVVSIALVLWMPEVSSLSGRTARPFQQDRHAAHITYRQMLSGNVPLLLFLLAGVVLYAGQTTAILFLVRVVASRGGGAPELGISMFLQSGVEMPAMFLLPRLLKRFRAGDILSFAFFAYTVKTLLLLLSASMPMIYVAMCTSVFGFGLYCMSSVVFVNQLVRPGERVRAQGMVALCGAAGGIIGSLFAGSVLDTFGLQTLLVVNTSLCALGTLIMLRCNRASRGFAPPPLHVDTVSPGMVSSPQGLDGEQPPADADQREGGLG